MASELTDREQMLYSSLLGGICTPFLHDGDQLLQQQQQQQKVVKRKRKKRARTEGEEAKKRKLSEEQARFLEMSFWKERKLESGRKVHLASELGLEPKQVAVWFQNRRARWKSKHLEEEYVKLKSAHEAAVINKYHLEAEILKLKEQLSEAQKDIAKLSSGGCGGGSGSSEIISSSPSTSFSVDTYQPFLGEFGNAAGANEEFVHINEYNYVNMLDIYGIVM